MAGRKLRRNNGGKKRAHHRSTSTSIASRRSIVVGHRRRPPHMISTAFAFAFGSSVVSNSAVNSLLSSNKYNPSSRISSESLFIMTSTRPFHMNDLFAFNNVNLDVLTETFNMSFYLQYMSRWPELFTAAVAPDGSIAGYMLGKSEGVGTLWHGHVSAVTVAPLYRRLGLAKMLMEDLESTSANVYNAYFVDLFVRASNRLAISMYEQFGYIQYRRVLGYYSGDDPEDALDMRKALPRDKKKQSVIPLDKPVLPEDLEW